jgi:Leucine Rich repeat
VCRLYLPLLFLLVSPLAACGQELVDEQVERWVAELGSPVFNVRQAASKKLAARGAKAVPALAAICESSPDRETVTRALQSLSQILSARDPEVSRLAEVELKRLANAADKSLALAAKSTYDHWRMENCLRSAARLSRLGAAVSQPTTAADGSPEVYVQFKPKEWMGKETDLELLSDLGRIGSFTAEEVPLTSDGLKFLNQCRSVDKIFLSKIQVDSRGMEAIASAPELHNLAIKGNTTLDREGLEKLRAAKALDTLSLDGSSVTSEIFPALAKLSALRNLDLSRTKITDEGLELLAELPKLHTLNLSGALIHGEGIAGLAKAPALDTLNLRGAELGPQAFDGIGRLEQVRYLILDQIDLSTADFAKLAGMKGLRRLDLAKCKITDNNARSLGSLTSLTYLHLRENSVSSEIRDHLGKQIPKAQILAY